MIRTVLVVALLLAACSNATADSTSITAPVAPTATTAAPATTSTLATIEACDEVPYRPLTVPERASASAVDSNDLGDDPYTTIPGTSIRVWVDGQAEPVMVLIRGALPPESWAGPTARVEVLRWEAALGPLPGDRWAVAWFESEDRCDLYTLLLYPPTSADEALEVAESLIPDR